MLKHLHIQNYALISHLDIDFQSGFSVITGETGAGKSIILGALALVMGARADTKSITEGESHCVIEADFGDLLIRRELHSNGRSRSFVNDEIVTQAELKTLADKLIDIHSQHANLLLENDNFQLDVIDAIANNNAERNTYEQQYQRYTDTQAKLKEIQETAARTRQDADYIAFQFRQLDEARLVPGEQNELEQEEYQLTHAEEIKSTIQATLEKLDNESCGAYSLIHSSSLRDVSSDLDERLHSVDIELKDIIQELNRLYEHTEFDPDRLQEVQERLDQINTLLRKHNKQTVEELIELRDQLSAQMQRNDSFDEEIAQLQKALQAEKTALTQAAAALTKSRQQVRPSICQQLIQDLSQLGIRHANIDIAITPTETFTNRGTDDVQFMFAANLNQTLRRVSEVASGGEISRLMLCIKSLIASINGLPTILFDEIDTGISGEVATQMGAIMREMAQSRQIIAITHLPQIAAQGQQQYRVYKQDTDTRTETNIIPLSETERITEIASMLAGKNITNATLQTAKQLMGTN